MTLPKLPTIIRFYPPLSVAGCRPTKAIAESGVIELYIDVVNFTDLQDRMRRAVIGYMKETGSEPIALLCNPVDFAMNWAFVGEMGTVIDAKRKVFTVRVPGIMSGEIPIWLQAEGSIAVVADPKDINRLYFR